MSAEPDFDVHALRQPPEHSSSPACILSFPLFCATSCFYVGIFSASIDTAWTFGSLAAVAQPRLFATLLWGCSVTAQGLSPTSNTDSLQFPVSGTFFLVLHCRYPYLFYFHLRWPHTGGPPCLLENSHLLPLPPECRDYRYCLGTVSPTPASPFFLKNTFLLSGNSTRFLS